MFHGDAAATDNVFYDYDVGYSDTEFDIRKFHGDFAGFDNVDDDSYNYDDNDSDVFDARKSMVTQENLVLVLMIMIMMMKDSVV